MINLIVIGGGKMGLSHLTIANSFDECTIKCVIEHSFFLRFFYKKLGFNTAASLKQYLNRHPKPDAALICVPTAAHFAIAEECLVSDISCFIEKPLTTSYSQSRKLNKLAKKRTLAGMVGYVNRFNKTFQLCRQLVQSGEFGAVREYDNLMTGAVATRESDTLSSWRFDRSRGGGCLLDYGPHAVDLGQFIFGNYSEVFSATMDSRFSVSGDDCIEATVRHESGVTGQLCLDWSRNDVRKATNCISVRLQKASIVVRKEELIVDSEIEAPYFSIRKGRNRISTAMQDSNVSYYLRGEEFTRQIESFLKLVSKPTSRTCSDAMTGASLNDGADVDWLIDEIGIKAGWPH